MNLIDFNKIGGYRLKQATLRKMQESYFHVLKMILSFLNLPDTGNFIISGCTISGANITSGYLFIDGELCYFSQTTGNLNSKIKKQIETSPLVFKNGVSENVFRKTSAVIDNSGTKLSDFVRATKIPTIPSGIVIDPADLTATPPEKTVLHRLEELESFAQSNFLIYLLRGSYPIGDAAEHEDFKTITFSNLGTTNYTVLGELISKGNYAFDNDITYAIREKTATSFKIILNDTGTPSQIQDLEFNYILIKN